jgi:hypothetical protein
MLLFANFSNFQIKSRSQTPNSIDQSTEEGTLSRTNKETPEILEDHPVHTSEVSFGFLNGAGCNFEEVTIKL